MKKISILGVLVESANWILHPVANYKELQEYRQDYDKEIVKFKNTRETLKEKIQIEKNKYNNLEQKYLKKKNKIVELEKALKTRENDIVLKKEEIQKMKITIRNLKQNLYYKNNVVEKLKASKKELFCDVNELDKERSNAVMKCLEFAKKVEFYEKQAKKTPKEKVDYLMGRNKKNEN